MIECSLVCKQRHNISKLDSIYSNEMLIHVIDTTEQQLCIDHMCMYMG